MRVRQMEWRAVVSRPRQATGPTGPASRRLGSRARTAWATFGGAGRSRSAPTCRPSCEWESRKVGGGGRCFVSASVSAQCSVFSAQCSVCAAHLGLAAPSHRLKGGGGEIQNRRESRRAGFIYLTVSLGTSPESPARPPGARPAPQCRGARR